MSEPNTLFFLFKESQIDGRSQVQTCRTLPSVSERLTHVEQVRRPGVREGKEIDVDVVALFYNTPHLFFQRGA
jgi:hypothetical protein